MKLQGNQMIERGSDDPCVLVRASKIVLDSPCEIEVDTSGRIDSETNTAEEAVVDMNNGNARGEFWRHPLEFLCSCLSMSIGLGNVFRFPFVVYENGGGAFLIAYVVVLCLIGRPLYLLEMAVGQFSSSGPVTMWNIVPFFKGVGYTGTLCTFCAVTYYASYMSLTVHYFVDSFRLAWSHCDSTWVHKSLCIQGVFQFNQTNLTLSQLYYRNKVFPQVDDIENGIGLPNPDLTICLLISWCIIYASLVKYSGKLSYFTAVGCQSLNYPSKATPE